MSKYNVFSSHSNLWDVDTIGHVGTIEMDEFTLPLSSIAYHQLCSAARFTLAGIANLADAGTKVLIGDEIKQALRDDGELQLYTSVDLSKSYAVVFSHDEDDPIIDIIVIFVPIS